MPEANPHHIGRKSATVHCDCAQRRYAKHGASRQAGVAWECDPTCTLAPPGAWKPCSASLSGSKFGLKNNKTVELAGYGYCGAPTFTMGGSNSRCGDKTCAELFEKLARQSVKQTVTCGGTRTAKFYSKILYLLNKFTVYYPRPPAVRFAKF